MKKKIILPILIFVLLSLAFAVSPLFATTGNNDGDTADTTTDTASGDDAAAEKSGGLVALTFDDGPGNCTNELLDELKKRDVKVTFFIVGSRVEEYADIIKREYEEGHELACHTWSHAKLTTLDAAGIESEISQAETAISAAAGADLSKMLLRPPGGSYNDTVKSSVGAPLILWSVDPKDWKYRDTETVKNTILDKTVDGSIILVHDLYPTSIQGAVAAIDELQAKGFTFVTVSELFRRKGIALTDGEVYLEAPNDGVDLGPLPEEEEETGEVGENGDGKNHGDQALFPWGLLIFCVIVLLVDAGGLLRLFWGCKPQWKEKNNEKNNSNGDADHHPAVNGDLAAERGRNNGDKDNDRQ
ncbi:MAG TPA: polysaccharide deacetylase family protein [Clostridiales bacterium]|nr:polysaccharide deacetylase family protein [Clostridiales bacterium]